MEIVKLFAKYRKCRYKNCVPRKGANFQLTYSVALFVKALIKAIHAMAYQVALFAVRARE
jgi:hypothetical protein